MSKDVRLACQNHRATCVMGCNLTLASCEITHNSACACLKTRSTSVSQGYAKAVGQTAGSVPLRCSTNAQKPQKPHQDAKNDDGDTWMITS